MDAAAFRRSLTELAWRQWTALGVTGWTDEAREPVDPEALIVFTARLGDADVRMRDAATDWCVAHGEAFVNETRLRSVIRELGGDDPAVSTFLATVAAAAGPAWSAGTAEPRAYLGRGKAHLPHLNGAGRLLLRLRAIYGVGARAEVIAALVGRSAPVPVTDLVRITRYTRPMVDRTLASLSLASLLRLVDGQRKSVVLNAPLFGWLDASTPLADWTARYAVTLEFLAFLERTGGAPPTVAAVDARRAFAGIAVTIDHAGLVPPDDRLVGDAYLDALERWQDSYVQSLTQA
jgi:hypothetical protein